MKVLTSFNKYQAVCNGSDAVRNDYVLMSCARLHGNGMCPPACGVALDIIDASSEISPCREPVRDVVVIIGFGWLLVVLREEKEEKSMVFEVGSIMSCMYPCLISCRYSLSASRQN